ncbi:MAG TPA: 3-methyl-2-oxobutanoate dehydrogenase subunit VorB [Candidatus Binatia bacterium]|nr:3-methyl-2-oxobutanoate dehydrogenase subunit VorB [Candidatus Binatia bacterium]
MQPQLTKGNEAVVKAAVLAGCRAFYAYPITPASEIGESAALYLPQVGGVFVQAESELAAINMLYGGAAAGVRVMTASSGPGISLMQEGISYLAGSELPCVIVDMMRGGPGLGNIGPEQGDYLQMVKGGGHGCYRNLVLAPASVQELADLTTLAFDLADRYRNPVVLLADGSVGQIMEPVAFADPRPVPAPPPWAVTGTAETRHNLINSIHLDHEVLERHIRDLEAKYAEMSRSEVRWESARIEDAEIVLVGYGMVGRVLRAVAEAGRRRGLRLGVVRPITLFPFPSAELRRLAAGSARLFCVVEMSTGQLVEDVRLALEGARPVELYTRVGGNIPTAEEILDFVESKAKRLAGLEVHANA